VKLPSRLWISPADSDNHSSSGTGFPNKPTCPGGRELDGKQSTLGGHLSRSGFRHGARKRARWLYGLVQSRWRISANSLFAALAPSVQRSKVWRHDVTLWQSNQSHPALDAVDTETQFPGDLPGRSIRVVQSPDPVEHGPTVGVTASPRLLRLFRFRGPARVTGTGGVCSGLVIGGCRFSGRG
jgi:hypothetical protein